MINSSEKSRLIESYTAPVHVRVALVKCALGLLVLVVVAIVGIAVGDESLSVAANAPAVSSDR